MPVYKFGLPKETVDLDDYYLARFIPALERDIREYQCPKPTKDRLLLLLDQSNKFFDQYKETHDPLNLDLCKTWLSRITRLLSEANALNNAAIYLRFPISSGKLTIINAK